ncbi:MAG: membrane dipeptidase [Nitrospinota bacterium]
MSQKEFPPAVKRHDVEEAMRLTGADISTVKQALELHKDCLVFDAVSFPYTLEGEYFERVKAGGMDATIMTAAYEDTFESALIKIDDIRERVAAMPGEAVIAEDVETIRKAKKEDKYAVVIGFQDSKPIGEDLWKLRAFRSMGLRVVQLTYTGGNMIGDGCGERTNRGLTYAGMELIYEMNRIGVTVDTGHCGDQTTLEALTMSKATPVITHANVRAICDTMRNKTDEALDALKTRDSVIGFTPLPGFVAKKNPTLNDYLDHIEYVIKRNGPGSIGLGLDYVEGMAESGQIFPPSQVWRERRPDIFGTVDDFFHTPYCGGLDSVAKLPNVTIGMLVRGYDEEAIRGLLGENWLRVLAESWI